MICPPQTNTRMTILSRQYNLTFKQLLRKIYYSKYYQEHKEKLLAHNKAYREANKEKFAKIQKAYYEENKEKVIEYSKAYREANKEKLTEYSKTYREANREKILQKLKVYNKANREKLNTYAKTYREENPEMVVEKVKVYREKLRVEKPKYQCPCGACILDWGYTVKNHEKTKKHQKWVSSQK